MKRIRLFIGSSTEALPIARAVKAALERQVSEALKDNIEVDLWSEIFDPGQYTMESIEDTAQTCDFAVMIFAPDDVVMSRGVTKLAPRDNVLAELGLFIGYLGRDRAFLLLDADEVVSLPSDLRGITFETYRKRDDNKSRRPLPPLAIISWQQSRSTDGCDIPIRTSRRTLERF